MNFEAENVHKFYETCASKFSKTRRKPWPKTFDFIERYYTPSSLVLDNGCGNGRCMFFSNVIGLDYSFSLLKEARSRIVSSYNENLKTKYIQNNHEHINNISNENVKTGSHSQINCLKDLHRGTIINLPYTNNTFDLILSVAVIHHLSTKERRHQALLEMKRVLKPGGKILLYVWSNNCAQQKKFTRLGEDTDFLVSWNNSMEFPRYYHLFKVEELVGVCEGAGFEVIEKGEEQESLYVVLC